ncbi:MAG TPA: putative baseplate assembly protein, partial [Acidimicrobiales bacterium]|nr:putative baseplate assembly protein [Acidimicrobiales bacterium]
MSLPIPNLDDRKYQDIVDEAKRLIPQHCPEWTNHNLSDPGVALIELFAWMSEMIMFRLNQVPDRLYLKLLDLVGVEPYGATAARADLTFKLSTFDRDVRAEVPKGTQVATSGADGAMPLVFNTLQDLVIEQPTLVAALTSTAAQREDDAAPEDREERFFDEWESFRVRGGGDPVRAFRSQPKPQPGDALYLGFESSLAGHMVQLKIEAIIEGLRIDPRRPPLVWEVWSGEAWIPCRKHEDTTGGLNANGEVVLLVPLAHEPLTLHQQRHFWLRAKLVHNAPGQPPYESSPRVRWIEASTLGGTVPAEHAQHVEREEIGVSNGTPDQSFTVEHAPCLALNPLEEKVLVVLDGVEEEWFEVPDFADSGEHDKHFRWEAATGTVHFGPIVRHPDGTVVKHGAVPPGGAEIVLTGYRYGGGAAGNVGAMTITAMQTTEPYIDAVVNLAPAWGGVDPESVANAKLRGPMSLRTGQRAVTARDFERLTLEASPKVARAHCLPAAPEFPGGPVRVLVVPKVDKHPQELTIDDFALQDDLVEKVRAELDVRRMIGSQVQIDVPYYQGVSVAALLRAEPRRPVAYVRARALEALYDYVNPLTGGPDGDGWPFDAHLTSAAVHQLLSGVDGVAEV